MSNATIFPVIYYQLLIRKTKDIELSWVGFILSRQLFWQAWAQTLHNTLK